MKGIVCWATPCLVLFPGFLECCCSVLCLHHQESPWNMCCTIKQQQPPLPCSAPSKVHIA
jgi:hypothetical protein